MLNYSVKDAYWIIFRNNVTDAVRKKKRIVLIVFYALIPRGRILVIEEACPPPDTGRGRGPQDTSSAIAGRSRLWEGPE